MAEITKENVNAEKSSLGAALGNVEELQTIGTFFNKYKNYIFIGLGILALAILAYMFIGKKGDAAKALKYEAARLQAEEFISRDSFDIALNGNGGEFIGLLNIIKKAKGTSTEKLAAMEAGVCYIGKNDGKNAVKYLESATGFGKQVDARRLNLLGLAKGIIAFESGKPTDKQIKDAVEYFEDAAARYPKDLNGATYLLNAVMALDKAEKFDDAKKICLKIKEKYNANENEMQTVDKYLAKYGVTD